MDGRLVSTDRKIWLGGLRNPNTGVEYHHASTESRSEEFEPLDASARARIVSRAENALFERTTQTAAATVSTSAQTFCENYAQSKRKDLYYDGSKEKIMIVKPYLRTSEIVLAERLVATKTLQRYWRGHLGRVKAEAAWKERRRARFAEQNEKEQAIVEALLRQEEFAAAHPTAALDALVREQLESLKLRRELVGRDPSIDEQAKTSALLEIVAEQAKVIHKADRIRRSYAAEAADATLASRLADEAMPMTRRRSDGKGVVTIATQATLLGQRRALLYETYRQTSCANLAPGGEAGHSSSKLTLATSLRLSVGTCSAAAVAEATAVSNSRGRRSSLAKLLTSERLAFLDDELAVYVHEVVAPENAPLASEMLQLIKRENDLLSRRRPVHTVAGLQSRLEKLLLKSF